jgi:TRAP transporter TAXI family solute receptor
VPSKINLLKSSIQLWSIGVSSSKKGGKAMKTFCSAFIGILLVQSLLGSADAENTVLKWGATSVHSGLYAKTVSIKRIVNKAYPGKIAVTVVATESVSESLMKIYDKSIHLGPAGTAEALAAYRGIMDYKGKAISELRSLWGGYITPIHIITSKKSKITSIQGLDGLPYAMNPRTSSGRLIKLFYDAQGVKPTYQMMEIAASVDAMKSEVVQGWFKAGFKDAMILDLEATMDINILPINKLMIDKMNAKYPSQGLSITVPAGNFKAIKRDQLSLAYVVSDFVHKDVPDEVVYKIVKAVWNKRAELVRKLSALKKGRFADMYQMAIDYDLGVPFHAGAARFYQEKLNFTIPGRFLPPEMKLPLPID